MHIKIIHHNDLILYLQNYKEFFNEFQNYLISLTHEYSSIESYLKYLSNQMNKDDSAYFLLCFENDNKLIGIIKLLVFNDYALYKNLIELNLGNKKIGYIGNLFISPRFRGNQYCERFLKLSNKISRDKFRIDHFVLCIHISNSVSIHINTKLGAIKTNIYEFPDAPYYVYY